jgi:DNA-binding PadR family transcriptional regulator
MCLPTFRDCAVVLYQSNRPTGRPLRPRSHLTDFEQILLGLTVERPRSGYDVKRFFASTPAVVYERSSGAVYPALRRLEQRGLLGSELAVSAGERGQRRYLATDAGQVAHRDWLRAPLDHATVGRDLGVHLMRFAMAERELSRTEVLAFLDDLGDALETFISEMEAFLHDSLLPGRHPALAVEHGLAVHRASLSWARSARDRLAHAGAATRPAKGAFLARTGRASR